VLQLTMSKYAGNCSRPHTVTLTRPLPNKVILGLSTDNNITLTALLLHLDTERGKEKHTEHRAFRRRFPPAKSRISPNYSAKLESGANPQLVESGYGRTGLLMVNASARSAAPHHPA
jgi:hypothetical protein